MARYTATVQWDRNDQDFLSNLYSRKHKILFDGGIEIAGSSSPHVVPVPMSEPAAVDPEEAFIASLSSCHMLWFLSIAAKQRFVVDGYIDHAEGIMGSNDAHKIAMTSVTLRPVVSFSGGRIPTDEEHEQMHHEAHEACFIASSVKTEVQCVPSVTRN